MANHTRVMRREPIDILTAARNWVARGIAVVPIVGRSKKPRGGEGWNKIRIDADEIGAYFKAGDNVGGLWGEASGWIVDVDLDSDESTAVAAGWLPTTFRYGRMTRPLTHYLYKSVNARSMKWIDEDKRVIVELRSSGMQSVLPPSIHPDGDQYVMADGNDDYVSAKIVEIECNALVSALNVVAALSLLARHYPAGGGRHDYVSAVVGALLRGGWSAADARRAGVAVVMGVGVRETDVDQRIRTIDNTISHHAAEDKTYGWPTLTSYIPSAAVVLIRRWLAGPRDTVPVRVRRTVGGGGIPAELLSPVGLVGDLMRWSARRSYVVQPVMDLAVGLMCTAIATMNRFVVSGWDTPLQPYMMLLAPTAGGKDSALRSVYEFCRRIRLGERCFQGFQSHHALLDTLASGSMAVWLWDEAARKLKSAARAGSPDYAVVSHLLSMYGAANGAVNGLPGRNAAVAMIEHPFLCVMAAAQPAVLMEAVTDADLSAGVINRFVLFDTGDGMVAENLTRDDTFPARVESLVRMMRDRPPLEGGFVSITMESAAYARFRSFSALARERCVEGVGEIWGRANQNALVVAGIVAAGMGGERPVIDDAVATWAIAFMTWVLGRWEARIGGAVARTRVERHSKTVEDMIGNARRVKLKGMRSNQVELLARGLMPRSVLLRMNRHLTARDLDNVLEVLIGSDVIGTNEVDGITVYWSK